MSHFIQSLSALPRRSIESLAQVCGTLWYRLDHRHRRIARHNIQLALGYRGDRAEELVKLNFVHLMRVFLEIPLVSRIHADNYTEFIQPAGIRPLTDSLQLGKGVLMLSGHFGNWEWMAHCAPFFIHTNLLIVARPLDSPWLNRQVTELRQLSGNRVISKKNAFKPMLSALSNNGMVGVLLDHNESRHSGIFVPFFGGQVPTNRGLAIIAIKTEAPVHPVFSWRNPSGKYEIMISEALSLPKVGSLQERIWHSTAIFNRCLENQIRYDPSQWYWIHRRFKHYVKRPDAPTNKKAIPRRISRRNSLYNE
jgi:KDO2-lipid IV(A) lauroyltransferase